MHTVFYQKNWRELNFFLQHKTVLLLLVTACLATNAQAQTYRGVVYNSAGVPLNCATVSALSLPDSAFLNGAITNDKGEFEIAVSQPADRLLFRISMLGYKTAFSPPSKIGAVTLADAYIQLEEAVVQGNMKMFDLKNGHIVCRITGTSLSSETRTAELLGKLPGFYMSGDQLKSINPGGIKYFLNHRPATEEEIYRLEVKKIKSVEIDRHPGSRFSGEVGTVVFIHTNQPLEGISGFIRSSGRVNHRFSQGTAGEISYQYKHSNLTLGADYTIDQSKPGQENTFELLQSGTKWKVSSRDTKQKNRKTGQTYFASFEQNFSENHHLSLRYTRQPLHGKTHLSGNLSVWDNAGFLNEAFKNILTSGRTEDNLNLYYRGDFNKHWTIDFTSDWYHQRTNSQQDLNEENRLTKIFSETNSTLWGLSPRAIYRKQGIKIETGVDWSKSIIHGSTQLNIEDVQPTDNKIEETKIAGYADVNWTAPEERWDASLGLRLEETDRRYKDIGADGEPSASSYLTLLPSFGVSYTFGKWKHQWSYNTSIVYPLFSQQISGDVYINRFNVRTSNPNLKQSVLHHVSYDLSFRWLYFSAGYTYTRRPIFDIFETETYQENYRIKVTPQNLEDMHGISLIANAAPRFGLYEPRLMAGYIQNFITIQGDKTSKPFVIAALNNSFSFPRDWTLSLDFSYNGAGSNGYIEFSRSSTLNFSVQKYSFNKSLQTSLKFTDIFNSSTPRITGKFQGILLNGCSWMDTRNIRLTLVWYFRQQRKVKKHSSISSEMNRL